MALHDATLEEFVAAFNHLPPSLIRVQADEVTYNLQIIIPFELELALQADELPIGELPDAWNQRYGETLGITPANHAEGCLVVIHWSAGLVGISPPIAWVMFTPRNSSRGRAPKLGGLDESLARGDSGKLLS